MPKIYLDARWGLAATLLALAGPLAATASAQESVPGSRPGVPVASAVAIEGPITLDGRLDEADWAMATPITDFTQLDPAEGQPVSERTEVRILYDKDALYIGVRLDDDAAVSSRLIRRDGFVLDSDWFSVSLDTYHNQTTALRFSVNPAGVLRDEVLSNDNGGSGGRRRGGGNDGPPDRGVLADASWNAVWAAATTVSDSGWVAEMRIPFGQLGFGKAEVQTWGIQLERRIAREQEQAVFAFTPKDDPAGIALYGTLDGLRGIEAGKPLELLPYVSGRVIQRSLVVQNEDVGFPNPFQSRADLSGGMGADLKYRVASNFTLNATLNPDFGQVEQDPAVVNLTAFETRLEEKRPFFVEGAEILNFGTAVFGAPEGGPPQLVYSRRLGRAPQLDLPSDVAYADQPENTTILGAAKLTGRTAGGWSIGVLEAATQREKARLVNSIGERVDAVVEPLTNYFAGRLKRDFNGGRTSVGGMITAVDRKLDDDNVIAQLRSSAYTGGIDFRGETTDRVWSVLGSVSPSYVTGSRAAIAATQASSARYFQRPDASYLELDSTATSLAGYRAQIDAGKRAGTWVWNVAMTASSPGYEINDFGYQTDTDRILLDPNLTYEQNQPGPIFRNWNLRAGPDLVWNYGWNLVRADTRISFQSQFLNQWSANASYTHSSPVLSDRLTRGGPLARLPAGGAVGLGMSSDPRRKYTVDVNLDRDWDRAGMNETEFSLNVGLKPASNWDIGIGPDLAITRRPAQYVTTVGDPLATQTYGGRYIFASLDQTTLGIETRLNVTFTPTLSLQLYAQPFLSSNDFGALKELRAPRTFDFLQYGRDIGTVSAPTEGELTVDPDAEGPASSFTLRDRDFNIASLRGDAVLRWEWRPGSALFLVWQQNRSGRLEALDAVDGRRPGDFDLGRNVNDLFDARPTNVFLFNVRYWLNL